MVLARLLFSQGARLLLPPKGASNVLAMLDKIDWIFARAILTLHHLFLDVKAATSEGSIVSAGDYADPVHNFVLSQRLATLLGNFPEVRLEIPFDF